MAIGLRFSIEVIIVGVVFEKEFRFPIATLTFEPDPVLELAELNPLSRRLVPKFSNAQLYAGSLETVEISISHVSGSGGEETVSMSVRTGFPFVTLNSATYPSVALIEQHPKSVSADKRLELTLAGLQSPGTFSGGSNGAQHDLIFDYRDDVQGLGPILTQGLGRVPVLGGVTSGDGIAYFRFDTVKLLCGLGPDFVTILATPQSVEVPMEVELGKGANEVLLLVESAAQLRNNFPTDLVLVALEDDERTANDTTVFEAQLSAVQGSLMVFVDGSILRFDLNGPSGSSTFTIALVGVWDSINLIIGPGHIVSVDQDQPELPGPVSLAAPVTVEKRNAVGKPATGAAAKARVLMTPRAMQRECKMDLTRDDDLFLDLSTLAAAALINMTDTSLKVTSIDGSNNILDQPLPAGFVGMVQLTATQVLSCPPRPHTSTHPCTAMTDTPPPPYSQFGDIVHISAGTTAHFFLGAGSDQV